MNAEIVAIGTELLLGFVVNSDTAYLGRVLAGCGVNCYRHVTVGDNPKRLAETLKRALSRSDLVITCGGLGPTVDDITLETISQVTGKPLILHPQILQKIRRRFKRIGVRMPKNNARQALLPQGAIPFPNEIGTAPGFMMRVSSVRGTRLLVALPGPPQELIPMVERHLIPRLRRFAGPVVIQSRTLKATGLTESEVDLKVKRLLALKGDVTVGIYAHPAQVDLRITAKAKSPSAAKRLIAGVERKIRRRLGPLIFGADEETLEGAVGKLLKEKKLTLGLAESCTGGLLGHRITQVPGSSDYFRGGVIAYSNKIKKELLGVSSKILDAYGAVSPQVAEAMAIGARHLVGAEMGLSITGIAGPGGGTAKKPAGLVYMGLSSPRGTRVFKHRFSGDRATVKFKASQTALNLVRCALLSR